MSQTDTPRHADAPDDQGGRTRRGLGRQRRDTPGGDHCQMCRQAVTVDASGRCPLGHHVLSRAELAARAEDGMAVGVEADTADAREPDLGLEIDLDRDPAPVAPLGFVHAGAGGALPERVVPRPLTATEPAPTTSAQANPGPSAQAATGTSGQADTGPSPSDSDLTKQLLSRSVAPRDTRWVPGVQTAGLRLETPTLLPDRANGRRLAQPDDRPLPVMEPTPPLPDPPPEDGPAVARALFHDLHEPTDDIDVPTAVTHELADATPGSAPLRLPEPPAAEKSPPPIRFKVSPVPAQPSALGARSGIGFPEWVTAADLSPSAPSALDVEGLPTANPRPEPVYEPADIEAEVLPSRGPVQWAAAAAFLAALAAAAWVLATTL